MIVFCKTRSKAIAVARGEYLRCRFRRPFGDFSAPKTHPIGDFSGPNTVKPDWRGFGSEFSQDLRLFGP